MVSHHYLYIHLCTLVSEDYGFKTQFTVTIIPASRINLNINVCSKLFGLLGRRNVQPNGELNLKSQV